MKKLLTLLLSLLIIASCSTNDNEIGGQEITTGALLYASCFQQKIIDKDPASIAFRLNTLLTSVVESEEEGVTIDNVFVIVGAEEPDEDDEEDEGKPGEKIMIKDRLFSTNTITDQGSGVWKIEFKQGVRGEKDFGRTGTITIDTKGKLLYELEEGESWIIDAKDYELRGSGMTYKCNFPNYYITGGTEVLRVMARDGETVERTRSWTISGNFKGNASNQEVYANWNFNYTVEQIGGESQGYEDALWAEYVVDGIGEGQPVRNEVEFEYKAKNLKYRMSCDALWVFGGVEEVTIKPLFLDPSVFPSDVVKYVWSEGDNNCESVAVMGYSGYTTVAFSGAPMGVDKQL